MSVVMDTLDQTADSAIMLDRQFCQETETDLNVLEVRKTLNKELYSKVYLIRKSENIIVQNYHLNEMKTPMHMSMGQEATVSGVCQALGSNSLVFGNYRSHALFLVKTMDVIKFFGEMYGKIIGTANGKSGSMHLSAPEHGFMFSSAIVGASISAGVGAAYANKLISGEASVAVFFGDGATDQGEFWESINFACLKKIPVMFVCEDNGYAVHLSSKKRQGFSSLTDVVSQYDCIVREADTTDPEEIYNLTVKTLSMMNNLQKPSFLRLKCYRYLEHVGINEDFQVGYRTKEEFNSWLDRDPVKIQRKKLVSLGISEKSIRQLEELLDIKALDGLKIARNASFPEAQELYRGVYYGE